jgi:hypothetical protein
MIAIKSSKAAMQLHGAARVPRSCHATCLMIPFSPVAVAMRPKLRRWSDKATICVMRAFNRCHFQNGVGPIHQRSANTLNVTGQATKGSCSTALAPVDILPATMQEAVSYHSLFAQLSEVLLHLSTLLSRTSARHDVLGNRNVNPLNKLKHATVIVELKPFAAAVVRLR